jgi:heptosyltransferase-3
MTAAAANGAASAPKVRLARDARVLVIVIARIGDTLMMTPVLRALRAAIPDGELVCMAHPTRIDVLRNLPYLDELVTIEKKRAALMGRLARRRFDYAIVNATDAAVLEYALRVADRVVAHKQADPAINARLWRIAASGEGTHHGVDDRLLLLEPFDLAPAGKRLDYVVSADEARDAGKWLAERGVPLRGGAPFLVGLQMAGFRTEPFRRWPTASFAALCERIAVAQPDARFVVFGDKYDVPEAEALRRTLGERVVVAAGQLDLRESAAILARTSLYIGVDTGPTHLAGALGLPMIGLYFCRCPGALLAPLEHPAFLEIVEHPRTLERCDDTASMAEVSVDRVWAAVENFFRWRAGERRGA